MREEPINLIDDSPVNGDAPRGLPLAGANAPSAGFTAVNGESQRTTSFRPEEVRQSITSPVNDSAHKTGPGGPSFHSHGWRPDEQSSAERRIDSQRQENAASNKRKRAQSTGAEGEDDARQNGGSGNGRQSPRRRITTTLDSAVDLNSPEKTNHTSIFSPMDRQPPEPAPIGPYARERSPVARWNQGEPPPKPRPETTERLAESLQKFQQTQQVEESQQQAQPSVENDSASTDLLEEDEGLNDDRQLNDPFDNKKRKRNFSNRTKTGCHTCRGRKKKCDEAKPVCNNCGRGGFICGGYGPKPPNVRGLSQSGRAVVQIQSKHPSYEVQHGPANYWTGAMEEGGRSYSHWGRVQPPELEPPRHYHDQSVSSRPPHAGESWPKAPSWPPIEHPPPYITERLPPADFQRMPSQQPYAHGAPQMPLPPPPSLPPEPWPQHPHMMPYDHHAGALSVISSSTSSSQRAAQLALSYTSNQPNEKDKMLRGQPFLHWRDPDLIGDRRECRAALERYNQGTEQRTGISDDERARFFNQILDPTRRPGAKVRDPHFHRGPIGTIDDSTIVESPFNCDYGYNIHLGKESVLQPGCYMQDACDISIGNRVIIGPNVKFYCITASLDSNLRKGSQGAVVAGAIKVEDDVFIGGDVIVLPFVTIGKGAVVGAGSVVTKDVKEKIVVAGNPAKRLRKIEGPSAEKHDSEDIQKQQERMQRKMVEYANSGFKHHSEYEVALRANLPFTNGDKGPRII